jgi:hypothetical protein
MGDKYPTDDWLEEHADRPGGRLSGMKFDNGTILAKDDLPPEHVSHPWGVAFTVLGTVLLDFDADACQSPSRAYLLDVTLPGICALARWASHAVALTLGSHCRTYRLGSHARACTLGLARWDLHAGARTLGLARRGLHARARTLKLAHRGSHAEARTLTLAHRGTHAGARMPYWEHFF